MGRIFVHIGNRTRLLHMIIWGENCIQYCVVDTERQIRKQLNTEYSTFNNFNYTTVSGPNTMNYPFR